MGDERIRAVYLIETAHPLEKAAAIMAGEQSSGTFVAVPGETPELVARFGAQVERIVELETVAEPSLPGSKPPRGQAAPVYRRAQVTLSFPPHNIGPSLPNLLTLVAGNLFELSPFSGLRLLDLELPAAFVAAQPGPQFGVAGTRRLAGVYDRPLIGTIIKPSVGLAPAETAALVKTLAEAGLDFVKDDELMANPPYAPLAARVDAVMAVVREHAQRTGKQVMVAFNITDDLESMLRHHDTVLAAGGTCIMVSLNSVGLTGLLALRKHSQLPIHGHRNGWGALSRHPLLGFSYVAWQKFWRLAGADHLHVNGLRNKFCESDASVIEAARTCLTPLASSPPVMPVFSSGQWADHAADTYAALQSVDLMHLAGGGIMAHPDGPAAGAAAMQQAWAAAVAGIPAADYARTHPELAVALEFFGRGGA